MGKFTEALECHRKALGPEATEKYSDEAHLNIGYILRSQEKFDEARSHFQKALDIDPEYKVAKEALAELDGIEETLELVQRVEAISNQSTEHMDEEGIGVFLDDVFYRMEELREEGKTIQEIILTRANLILRSNSWDTRILFGDSLRRVGLNDEANRQLRWALKDADKDKMSAICYQLGLLHSDSSSPEEGEEWFRRGTEEFQTPFCNLWVERGINLIRLSDFEKARECFEKALACGERDHELSDAYFQLGKLARCFEEFDDAKKFFNKAKKLYPNNKEACIALNGLEGLDETLALCKRLRAMGV